MRCPMWVHLYSHDSVLEGFVLRILVDFASELVGLLAVHAPRLTSTSLLDLAQPLKEQDTAWVFRAHSSNDAGDFIGCVLVHATDMPPELLVTVFPFDWFSRQVLLFRNALQVLEACLIESMIGDKQRLHDRVVLPHRDHCEVFDIQIDTHRHKIRILLALNHSFGGDLLGLREM